MFHQVLLKFPKAKTISNSHNIETVMMFNRTASTRYLDKYKTIDHGFNISTDSSLKKRGSAQCDDTPIA